MTNEEAINLLDNLVGMVEDNHDADYDTALCMAIKALEELPKRRKEAKRWKAKAAQKQRTGIWMKLSDDTSKCSRCSTLFGFGFVEPFEFCPRCGARMESEEQE